jgi:hypothetical protein
MGLVAFNHLSEPIRECLISSLSPSLQVLIGKISTIAESQQKEISTKLLEVVRDKNRSLKRLLEVVGPPLLGEEGELPNPFMSYERFVDCLVQKYQWDIAEDVTITPPADLKPEHLYAIRKKMEADLQKTHQLVLADPSKRVLAFDDEVFDLIISSMMSDQSDDQLPQLHLKFASLSDQQLEKICRLITSHKLSTLSLESCGLHDSQAESIAEALKGADYSFQCLNLNQNAITDRGSLLFGEALTEKTITLVLTNNMITDETKQRLLDHTDQSEAFSILKI